MFHFWIGWQSMRPWAIWLEGIALLLIFIWGRKDAGEARELEPVSKAMIRISWPKRRRLKILKECLLARGPTPLADIGIVPLRVFLAESRMIVPPDRNEEENEHEWSDCNVDFHGKR